MLDPLLFLKGPQKYQKMNLGLDTLLLNALLKTKTDKC
jgi:hypothetical protein